MHKVYLRSMSTSLYYCFIYGTLCVAFAPSYISIRTRYVLSLNPKPHPSSIPTPPVWVCHPPPPPPSSRVLFPPLRFIHSVHSNIRTVICPSCERIVTHSPSSFSSSSSSFAPAFLLKKTHTHKTFSGRSTHRLFTGTKTQCPRPSRRLPAPCASVTVPGTMEQTGLPGGGNPLPRLGGSPAGGVDTLSADGDGK